MISASPGRDDDVARGLRLGLLAIAALGVVGTAVELALGRHWGGFWQWMPWPAVVATGCATVALAVRPTARNVRLARAIGTVVIAVAVLGVARHVVGNYETAPLDAVYGPKWETMSRVGRWWAASGGEVGPAPPLAPAALAMTALCVMLSTWRHPARRRR